MNQLASLRDDLQKQGSPEKAANSAWFFKTGPGQYGEGDIFIGVSVPDQRKIAKRYSDLSLADLDILLKSGLHEERLTALIILVSQYKKADKATQKTIYDFYMQHTQYVNNWDLVDSSACYIVGPWLKDKDKTILTKLAQSDNLWERRIAILSTFAYIQAGDSTEALKIAEILVQDEHDLIQKAVGWMLREIGKRCSFEEEQQFLIKHYKAMPRTCLRYAIERFPEPLRQKYLKGEI